MEQNKHKTTLSIIVILFVIIIASIFLVKGDGQNNAQQPENENPTEQTPIAAAPKYMCGMTVTSPLPNSIVTFPLTINGDIDNLAATDGCTWLMFEGLAGTVSISDINGQQAAVGLSVIGDWTGNVPVTFTGVLNPPVSFPSGTPLTLTFTEEDPSGGENPGVVFSYQVIAQ
ncbi:MAG TPA: hypothetical protein PK950_01450 [Candidatus Paceibacterota bacterium]|nr:hypothetical protein [Candidatus Paceibacterota bacterium]